jgi:hypothetical protein
MNALRQTSCVVTQAARQNRIFWTCVRHPRNDVRQDGAAAPAGWIAIVTTARNASAMLDGIDRAGMRSSLAREHRQNGPIP